ncbi:MAG TPA: class I SAM-dependent methyltransferase [Gemmataceae bacterium]|nr:class I SAM-dependent methyltransferase [Gemmataceae bacterium]
MDPMFHAKGPSFWELAEQALSSTEHGYDLLAPKFEYTPFRTPDIILDRVGEYLQTLGPVATSLDICCGTGAAMRMLRPHTTRMVAGIDTSAGMLAEARRLTADASGNARLEFVRADALRMPFDGAFDLAVCFGAFGHILVKDEPRFVAQVAQVLRPGGRFVFVSGYMPPLWSPIYWMARGFNFAMHVRNLIKSPPFIMFYLTFLLPGVQDLLEANGFAVEVAAPLFDRPWTGLRLVTATKK